MTHPALHTEVCTLFGIAKPVFGFSHSLEVTVALAQAGGFGVYGATRDTPEVIRKKLRELRDMSGDRPFGVDLLLPSSVGDETDREAVEAQIPAEHRAFVNGIASKYAVPPPSRPGFFMGNLRSQTLFAEQIEAVMESDADVIATAVGTPPLVIAKAKAAGKKTISLVGSPRHAAKVKALGVDLIVAQGYDAGGHTGPIGTFSLVPQVVDVAGDTPVLAAGGVGHGRHLAAALALGAQGVWMGTAWLTTKEHAISRVLLDKLLAAKSEDTTITRAYSGKTARFLKSAYTEEWEAAHAPKPLPMPYQQVLIGELWTAINEHEVPALITDGAGQSVAYFNELLSVSDVMKRVEREATMSLQKLERSHGAI